jgi:hypothetical protein
MYDIKKFLITYQQKIALTIGYILVAILGFGLGQITSFTLDAPKIEIVEQFNAPQVNTTQNTGSVQSSSVDNCEGKIKGNISSSSRIYHMPGGSFYNRTNAEMCFDTEQEAQDAGFRKSQR